MKAKRPIIVLGVALAAVALLVALFSRPEAEPAFGGKPMSDWLSESYSDYPRRNLEAIHALRVMGQPAVLRLVGMVERQDSFLRQQVSKHADKVPMLDEHLPSKYSDRYFAARALGAIGTNAAAAIPALEKMTGDEDESLANTARAALVLIRGDPVEPIMAEYRDNRNPTNSIRAFQLLVELGPHAEALVPTLITELQSTNGVDRMTSLVLLSFVGAESRASVSAITNLLTDSDPTIRSLAVTALIYSGPLAMEAAPLIARLLTDPNSSCRSSALACFMTFAESNSIAPYKPALQKMTNDPDATVRSLANAVLTLMPDDASSP